jgi:putative alpha-1,2-mannosidase
MLGAPLFETAEIKLPGNKSFSIKAENFSPKNIFVESVFLNGEKLDRAFITHKEIISGGELTFIMSNKARHKESRKRPKKTPQPDKIYH